MTTVIFVHGTGIRGWKNWQAGKVLLVFDDVKDWMKIKPYLSPKGSRFKVLITTRLNTGLTYPSLPLGELSPDANACWGINTPMWHKA